MNDVERVQAYLKILERDLRKAIRDKRRVDIERIRAKIRAAETQLSHMV